MPDSDGLPVSEQEIELLRELTDAGVPFMLVGLGAAVLRDFDSEYGAAIDLALVPGLIVKVLPIDRVLASKRAADRPKDRAVIPALEAAIAAIKESPRR